VSYIDLSMQLLHLMLLLTCKLFCGVANKRGFICIAFHTGTVASFYERYKLELKYFTKSISVISL